MNKITEAATGKIQHSTSKHSALQINPLKDNRKPGIFIKIKVALVGLALFGSIIVPSVTLGFTQSGIGIDFVGNLIPMGHEWITRLAVLEIIGGDPIGNKLKDPNDPRKHWTKGLAKNTNLSSPGAKSEVQRIKAHPIIDKSYESGFKFVYDAILGERWVDIGGFNVTKGEIGEKLGKTDCWDVVAQEAVEVQYDHFMRRYDDRGGKGGVQAAQLSRARFIDYFVAAAMASPGSMKEWDGGGSTRFNKAVDRNYFLFGRAVHLFEDSFSSEHTVRIAQDNYEQLRQTKSYLCAAGSEQHNHSEIDAVTYKSGDVIWKVGKHSTKGWSSYVPSNMKIVALVAVEANKDLWAAFIRTMGTPLATREQKAQSEAQTLVDNWFHMNETEMLHWYDLESHRDDTYVLANQQTGKGQTMEKCVKGLFPKAANQMEVVNKFASDRRTCLYNILPKPRIAGVRGFTYSDPSLLMPFNWQWRHKLYLSTPPPGWQPGMVTIPKGCYQMGWAGTLYDMEGNSPPHKVCEASFYMDTHEVTQREYKQETGKNPSHFKGPSHPVENVTWVEADAYCRKVGKRLPTEAEWEYAEKAEWNYNYFWGNGSNIIDHFAWYAGNSSGSTHRVGGKLSNNWDLFDMSGNVWEWVHDWYESAGVYYENSPVNNPQGPSSGKYKVIRGGSWGNANGGLLTYNRARLDPSYKNDYTGFRCAKDL